MGAKHGSKTWSVGFVGFGVGVVTAAGCDNSFFFPPSLDLLVVIAGSSSPAWSRRLGWGLLSLAVQTCPRVPSTALMLWGFFSPGFEYFNLKRDSR